MRPASACLVFVALFASAAGASRAAEGVLQINQACVAEGCFPGDDPGWPVTIESPGSYRLTSALDLGDIPLQELGPAVHATAAGTVELDLNGFSIRGPVSCSLDGTVECNTSAAVGNQAAMLASAATLLRVRDGEAVGFSYGVHCLGDCEVDRLVSTGHSGRGILIGGDAGVVRNSRVSLNQQGGIIMVGVVESNVVHANNLGMFLDEGSVGRDNLVRDNVGTGVICQGCMLEGNTIRDNTANGVTFSSSASWRGNSLVGNGNNVAGSAVELGPNQCGLVPCP